MDTIKIKIKCAEDGTVAIKFKCNGETKIVRDFDHLIEFLTHARDSSDQQKAAKAAFNKLRHVTLTSSEIWRKKIADVMEE